MNHLTVDTFNSPWNQELEEGYPGREVEVTISVTLSKTLKINVNDYKTIIGKDEGGSYIEFDFSNCNLKKAVKDQLIVPQELAVFVEKIFSKDSTLKNIEMPKYLKNAVEDCRDWHTDEMEVIFEGVV